MVVKIGNSRSSRAVVRVLHTRTKKRAVYLRAGQDPSTLLAAKNSITQFWSLHEVLTASISKVIRIILLSLIVSRFLDKFEYWFVSSDCHLQSSTRPCRASPPISPDVRGITCDVTSCLSGPHSYQKHSLTGHTNLISGSIIY